jgi:hypothetical protein
MLSAHKGQPEYSNAIFTALRDIALDGPDTIALTDDLSLVRPDQTFLAHRWDDVMTQAEIKDEATASRYLVCHYPAWTLNENATQQGRERLFNGLIAIHIVKPIQTLGIVHSVPGGWERRPPMDAGSWARMRPFDDEFLRHVPSVIDRVQRAMAGNVSEPKNALALLQLGLEQFHPYIAGLLWVAGIDAMLGSSGREDFANKLCGCLGTDTFVFPDWNGPFHPPDYTVSGVATHLYTLRNKLAHGVDLRSALIDKKHPVDLLAAATLTELSDPTRYADVLCQGACYLLCQVLRRML